MIFIFNLRQMFPYTQTFLQDNLDGPGRLQNHLLSYTANTFIHLPSTPNDPDNCILKVAQSSYLCSCCSFSLGYSLSPAPLPHLQLPDSQWDPTIFSRYYPFRSTFLIFPNFLLTLLFFLSFKSHSTFGNDISLFCVTYSLNSIINSFKVMILLHSHSFYIPQAWVVFSKYLLNLINA